jgi:hypothetical protein
MTAPCTLGAVVVAHHRHMLEVESGIRADVMAARGYRTITRQADAKRLGFSDSQCRVPALLVPVWGLSGDIVTYQLRPDIPRISRGKAIKYETPKGSAVAMDCSPLIRDQVLDVRVPLFITEGVKKADAAISHGGCCLALLGVWNWRGRDDHGGKRLLADFERIPLNDREVFLVFDSDLLGKDPVAQALIRLGRVLEHSFHAVVRVVHLPPTIAESSAIGGDA